MFMRVFRGRIYPTVGPSRRRPWARLRPGRLLETGLRRNSQELLTAALGPVIQDQGTRARSLITLVKLPQILLNLSQFFRTTGRTRRIWLIRSLRTEVSFQRIADHVADRLFLRFCPGLEQLFQIIRNRNGKLCQGVRPPSYPSFSLRPRLFLPESTKGPRDGNPEIYALDLATKRLTRLTDNPAYDTAPQLLGRRIVFQSNRDGQQRIYSMNLDGSELNPVTPDQVAEEPQWIR